MFGEAQLGGGNTPPNIGGWLIRGPIKMGPIWGDQTIPFCIIIFEPFALKKAHCLGWECNDPW